MPHRKRIKRERVVSIQLHVPTNYFYLSSRIHHAKFKPTNERLTRKARRLIFTAAIQKRKRSNSTPAEKVERA